MGGVYIRKWASNQSALARVGSPLLRETIRPQADKERCSVRQRDSGMRGVMGRAGMLIKCRDGPDRQETIERARRGFPGAES
jgi:hypothetical protein